MKPQITAADLVLVALRIYQAAPHITQDDPYRRLTAIQEHRGREKWDSESGAVRGPYVIAAANALTDICEFSDEIIRDASIAVGSPIVPKDIA